MPVISTHDHFMACLEAFLKQVSVDTGLSQPKEQNMLQFSIGLGAGVGPVDHLSGPPLKIVFRECQGAPMKTILHIMEEGFTNTQAQRIAAYFNHKHGANVAKVAHIPYLKGNHETIEILSGALVDELETAIQYQEVHRSSLMAGNNIFMALPIKDDTKAELRSPNARINFTPSPKHGAGYHGIEFAGISESAQADILAAIDQQYGSGSVHYGT